MRILHITEAADYGVLRHLSLIIPELIRQGHECQVLLFGNRIAKEISLPCSVSVFPFRGSRLLYLPKATGIIRREVRESVPDIVHLHAFTAGVAGRLALRNSVYSPHAFGIHPPVKYCIRKGVMFAERLLSHHTGGYVLVSQCEYDDALLMGETLSRLHICVNGLPSCFNEQTLSRSEARKALGQHLPRLFEEGTRVGVVPARLASQKNPQLVLQALRLLGDGQLRIVFCGDGPLFPALQSRNESAVFFLGRIPDLWKYLRAFDFAVLPSFYEGLSYSLLECLATGLPIAASSGAVSASCLTGHVQEFSPYSAESAAKAISVVSRMPLQSPFIPFTVEAQVQKLLALYRQVQNTKA